MVYVHVPFCESFCTYCDFYSETACDGSAFESYCRELCREAELRKDEIAASAGINTLYIGGGTPSVLPLSCIRDIAQSSCLMGQECGFAEFTVEVNPEDIIRKGESYVKGLLEVGVNRISMGIQSLDDGILRWMNRRHDSDGALKAFGILRDCGVTNISVDVIFGISILTDEMLSDTLHRLCALRPDHISAYQLSIEEGSALSSMLASGKYQEADEDQCCRQYRLICDTLKTNGYDHYEISNWALPGKQAVHNSAYWTRDPYVGLGPGAHSLSIGSDGGQVRSWNSQTLTGWKPSSETLTPKQIREEEIMLGLRTSKGWNGRILTEQEWFVADSIIVDYL